MVLTALLSKDALLSAGPLGRVYACLHDALGSQDRSAIEGAQAAAEALLVELLPGHVQGRHVGVADLWNCMASVKGSKLALQAIATARCSCGKRGRVLAPKLLHGWTYDHAICINSSVMDESGDLASAMEVAVHNLRANKVKHQSSDCCSTLAVYDVSLHPQDILCVWIQEEDVKVVPRLSHLAVNKQLFLLGALIVRTGCHYSAYFSTKGVSWLGLEGWYYYDGISKSRLLYLGSKLHIEKCHAHQLELLLFLSAT